MKNIFIFAILFVFVASLNVYAQGRWQIGPHFAFAFPNKDFANVTTVGEGLGAKVMYRLGNSSWLVPRLDIIYLSYGEKRSSTGGGSAPGLLIETRNESFQFSGGFHIAKPDGGIRPYFAPMGGVFNYRAVVTLPELYYYYGYPAMDTRDSQWKWGTRLQGGFLFDIGLGPLLDISLTYQHIFDVETKIDDKVFHSDAKDLMVNIGLMIFTK